MKKISLKLLFSFIIILITIISCGKKKEEKIRIAAIKGPPAMGVVKLFSDNEEGKTLNKYDSKIVSTSDEIIALIGKGELDIATVPSNLASVLYNKTEGKIQVASIIAFGILYIVENEGNNLNTLKDLKGKTIYANGKGATPEIVLKYILKGNGLELGKDVKIEFKSEATEVINALSNDKKGVALLNQPFLTVAQSKNPKLRIAFSIEVEWDKIIKTNKGSQVSGVIIVNKNFAEKNPKKVENFLKEYEQSVKFIKENSDEGAKLISKYGIIPEPIAKKAILGTNITYVDGNEMKEKISEYLKILFEEDPKIIGGKIPKDDFYYIK